MSGGWCRWVGCRLTASACLSSSPCLLASPSPPLPLLLSPSLSLSVEAIEEVRVPTHDDEFVSLSYGGGAMKLESAWSSMIYRAVPPTTTATATTPAGTQFSRRRFLDVRFDWLKCEAWCSSWRWIDWGFSRGVFAAGFSSGVFHLPSSSIFW